MDPHSPATSQVDSGQFEVAFVPDFNQPVLQFVDDVDFLLVYTTLHDSPDVVVNRTEIWTAWRPKVWTLEQ